jgi:hypothetical protein
MMPAFDPVRDGGTLYVVGDNGQLFSVDPDTGADHWPPVAVGFMYGDMALAGGPHLLSLRGSVVVLDAATGDTLRSPPHRPRPLLPGPAVAGLVYWLSGSKLNAWSLLRLAPSSRSPPSVAAAPAPPAPPCTGAVPATVSIAIAPNPSATDSANPDAPLDAVGGRDHRTSIGARVNFVNASLRDGADGSAGGAVVDRQSLAG